CFSANKIPPAIHEYLFNYSSIESSSCQEKTGKQPAAPGYSRLFECLFLGLGVGDDFLERSRKARKALDLARDDDLGRSAVRCGAECFERFQLDDLLARRGIVEHRNGVCKRF